MPRKTIEREVSLAGEIEERLGDRGLVLYRTLDYGDDLNFWQFNATKHRLLAA